MSVELISFRLANYETPLWSVENFSAGRYETYKNFLRLHIGPEGVTVYPIGIDRPCTDWKVAGQAASPEDSYIAPASGTIGTRLIEPPFTI